MVRRVLFACVLVLLFLPALQKWFEIISIPELKGDFTIPQRPTFKKTDWLEGKFQDAYISFLEQKGGFHDLLIRVNNQVDFTFFRSNNTKDIVIGKNVYILGNEYIRAYLGHDYIGEKAIDKKLRRLKYLQEQLKLKGKDLVLVLEPGKVSFYPELIPDYYHLKYPRKRSNYQAITQRADQLGIEYIDFNRWFVSMKETASYPLYPKTGIHWSAYGAWKAADSLVKYIEKKRNIDLPEMIVDTIVVTDNIKPFDYDAAHTLNLICNLDSPPMPYPEISFPKSEGKEKASVLVIGDSYYWNIFNTGMGNHLYKDEKFWYFNSFVYPESYIKETKTDCLDLVSEVEKRDIIFLMVTECWLSKFDFDFIDKLFDLYTPELEPDYPYLYEGKIRRYSDWFNLVAEKAVRNRLRLEDMIQDDALYTFRNERKEKFLLRFGPRYYKEIIESDKEWFAKEKEKAKELKTDLNTIIVRDCWYLFNNEHPDLCRIYTASLYNAARLKEDKEVMKKISNNPWNLRTEEMLWQVSVAQARGFPQSLAFLTW
ncbi:MAG: hypothetical protein AB9842_07635 [Bacteroidales bacterium]